MGLTAAINGDFFADSYMHSGAGRPSGLLVHDRSVLSFGWGGPAVGYLPGGDMIMGRPQAVPALIKLPNSKTATVEAFNSLSSRGVAIHGDQVGAYVVAGAKVTVPTGYVGFVLPSIDLRTMLHGAKGGYRYVSGSNMSKTVAGFRFEDPAAAYRTVSIPTSMPVACPSGTCAALTQLTVPVEGAVVLAKAGGIAATGLSIKAAAGGALSMAADNVGWDAVDDVMGGKPSSSTTASRSRPGPRSWIRGSGTTRTGARPSSRLRPARAGWWLPAEAAESASSPPPGPRCSCKWARATQWDSTTTRRPSCTGRA